MGLDVSLERDSIMRYYHLMHKPSFDITEDILNHSVQIAEMLGFLSASRLEKPNSRVRKQNKIQTIHSSLAIEGNTLSIDQVSDMIDHKPVVGPEKDIKEVKNAIAAYDAISEFNFRSVGDLKKAHKLFTQGLIRDAGVFRAGNVGVFAGGAVSHMAPPAKRVPQLMSDLFSYLKKEDNTSLLIKACVFHYELEFIHPFSDGNGRMGRFWQQVILMQHHAVFEFLSIESLIKAHQAEYYHTLGECDAIGNSTLFIEFALSLIEKALCAYRVTSTHAFSNKDRIQNACKHFKKNWFTRQDYISLHQAISTATASRDLKMALDNKWLQKKGEKSQTRYQFCTKAL